MQWTAFQALGKQAEFESWEIMLLFLALICAGVNAGAILTVELKGMLLPLKSNRDATLLPRN